MFGITKAVWSLGLLFFVDPSCSLGADAIPAVIESDNGKPAWVSAKAALDAENRLRFDLLGDAFAVRTNLRMNAGQDDCKAFIGPPPAPHFERTDSLDELTVSSEAVISATVQAIAEGFRNGRPGMLLRLGAGSALKGDLPPNETYVFYPYARIRTADGLICARPAGEFTPPVVGDRVIAFAVVKPFRAGERTILAVDAARELIHESRSGKRHVPSGVRGSVGNAASLADIEKRVRAAAGRWSER